MLSGHIHRHQVLRSDLRGRPLAAPVVYAGSVERTSFAERDEVKGFVTLALGAGGRGGRLLDCDVPPAARAADARPRSAGRLAPSSLERSVRAAIAAAPPDVVLQLRVPVALAGAEVLRAARLRALAPQTANVTVSVRGLRPHVAAIARGR